MSDVLKWAWRHHALEVDAFATLDEALRAAHHASDAGEEALESIEVPADGRVIPADEVWELMRPIEEAEMASWRAAPPAVARLRLTSPSGKSAAYSSYTSMADAYAAAQEFNDLIGQHRVAVEPFAKVSR